MTFDPKLHSGRLRRLDPAFYRGTASVHWTMTIEGRATGWLTELHHAKLREVLCHVLLREKLICAAYCLMPDHGHFLWTGCAERSDQRSAAARFRSVWNRMLREQGFELDLQPYDHVLRDSERERSGFSAVCEYIFENPLRAGLVARRADYAQMGSLVPGYPELDPRAPGFWDHYWRVFPAAMERFG